MIPPTTTTSYRAGHVRIGVCTFRTGYEVDEPSARWLEIVQADPVIEITDQILENADPSMLVAGDGIMTIHARNGDVSYGLCEHDDISETWIGVRADVAAEDLE